ncbi:lysylphosphatidylglycerol synthase domain-containing protein [Paenibacillus sp. ATY16]|uniref:lysylphosphatidylglycerol synthase domain-containing protein n=1 Tax=Paenibacillus sp. ATY16 TaxID=1759312 RepID=UPI000E2E4D31|nr:lysylphosphatidylglycerol synthase domain-containing protein [Paenibacillus sp. ATY16]MCK9858362.1 flippase-like domain-containing protein [Paenibacillus sp. ATY16]
MPLYRKLAPTVLKVAVLAIIVVFIVRNIPLKLEDLTSFLVHANDRFYLSLLLFSIFLMLQAGIWVLIVNASLSDTGRLSGSSGLSMLGGLRIFIETQFGKYIPGGFWNVAGRIVMATKAGVPLDAQFAAIVYENILLVAAALVYAMMLIVSLHIVPVWVGLLLVIVFALIYLFYSPLTVTVKSLFIRASKWKFLQKMIGKMTKSFGGAQMAGSEVSLTRNQFFAYLACFLASHFVMGIAFWLLTNSFDKGKVGLFYAAGTFATSWLLGLVSPLPGGLGVREGFLVYFLSMKLGTETALQISVIARLWNIMAEVLFWAVIRVVCYLTRGEKVYET